jgi:putative peptidoglycan binding protein
MTASPMSNMPGKPQPGEQFFQQSLDDLSRRLAERSGRQSPPDLQAQAEARRRAMQASERERARKLRFMLTGTGVVLATAGIAWTVVMLGQADLPDSPRPVAAAQPATPTVLASTVPAPSAVTATSEPPQQQAEAAAAPPSAATDLQPPVEPAQVASPTVPEPTSPPQTASADPGPRGAAATQSEPARTEPAPAAPPGPPPLTRPEIREVQKRLRGFGFDPGPVDGVAGRQTEIATQRYLEARGQPQVPPTDPQLLDQLRQDPTVAQAPPPTGPTPVPTQVAQRPAQQGWRGSRVSTAQPAARGSFDPFQPVKYAGTEITRFLQSVFR